MLVVVNDGDYDNTIMVMIIMVMTCDDEQTVGFCTGEITWYLCILSADSCDE